MPPVAAVFVGVIVGLMSIAVFAFIFVIIADFFPWHPIKAIRRFWRTTQLRPKNRPDPVLKAAEEAKTAIENYRHTKRVRNREDADRWYLEYKALGGIPEPMLVEAKPTKKGGLPRVVKSHDGGIRVVDEYGNVLARY